MTGHVATTIRSTNARAITVPIVSLDFRVTPRFGLQASTVIPLIARTGIVHRTTGDTPFRDEVRGLGDTVAGAWYRGGSPSRWSWTLNGGVSLPTGQTRAPRFLAELDDGSLVPLSRLQRGSGTVDPTFGVSAEYPLAGGGSAASRRGRRWRKTPMGCGSAHPPRSEADGHTTSSRIA